MKSLSFVSLGCDKNLVDSEVVIGKLLSSKYTTITTPEAADLIAINTCCFINEATQETESWIDRLIQIKRKDPHKTLVVLGCYPHVMESNYPRSILKLIFGLELMTFPLSMKSLPTKFRIRYSLISLLIFMMNQPNGSFRPHLIMPI